MANRKLSLMNKVMINIRYTFGASVKNLAKDYNVTTRTIYRHVK